MLVVPVRRTRDDILVVHFDAFRKIGDRDVPICQVTLSQWQQSVKDGPQIATLDQVLGLVAPRGVGVLLDVRDSGIEGLVARALRKSMIPKENLMLMPMGSASRAIFKGLDPNIPIAHRLEEDEALVDAKLLAELDTDAVVWHHRLLNSAFVKILNMRKIKVYAYSADLAEDMRRTRDILMVDGIVTRYPDLLATLPVGAPR